MTSDEFRDHVAQLGIRVGSAALATKTRNVFTVGDDGRILYVLSSNLPRGFWDIPLGRVEELRGRRWELVLLSGPDEFGYVGTSGEVESGTRIWRLSETTGKYKIHAENLGWRNFDSVDALLAQLGIRTIPLIGTEYRLAVAASRQRITLEVDLSELDRGLQGHVDTQNTLALYLHGLGLLPRSPTVEEPVFDIAWQNDSVTFVGEIKSLTDQNQNQQLRLGLGQILHYAHELRSRFPGIRAVLVVERRPSEYMAWRELCEHHGVILTWPDAGSFERFRSELMN